MREAKPCGRDTNKKFITYQNQKKVKMNRLLLCLGVPFLICVVTPSILGAMLINSSVGNTNVIYQTVGGCIAFGLPTAIIISWYATKPKKQEQKLV